MSDTLCDLIQRARAQKFATDAGTYMHERLRKIIIDNGAAVGDGELAAHIISTDGCAEYFNPRAKTEVPIAGTINGKFISRRIDRMIMDTQSKTIKILDYKTDTTPDAHRAHYVSQLREYRELLQTIYPGYKISAAILWTHDWRLENI